VLHLCVMKPRVSKPERVGIRALRQNLSVYVKRVREEGRAYEVTERGEPVARLTPLDDRPRSTIQRMIAEGRVTPARLDIASLPPPIARAGRPVSEIIREMRDDERW
jgi:prevent-host-death family protein